VPERDAIRKLARALLRVVFLHRHHPPKRVGQIDDGEPPALYRSGREPLGGNLSGVRRVTGYAADGAASLWIYRRAEQPGLRCGAPIG